MSFYVVKRWLYAIKFWFWFSAHFGYNKKSFAHGLRKYDRRMANFNERKTTMPISTLILVGVGTGLFIALMVYLSVRLCRWYGPDPDDEKWIGQ
jgi:formate/nitrite transporter FocA (FNT family)